MAPTESSPGISLQTLPFELITDILRGVDDWKSLQAAIRTCRVLYDAYRKGAGMAAPLFRMIQHHPNTLHVISEHVVAHRSIDYDDVVKILDIPKIIDLVASRWDGADIAMLCRKRRLMLQTRDEFFADIFSRLPCASRTRLPLSILEKRRFNITFLHYMIFQRTAKLPPYQGRQSVVEAQVMLVSAPPWINEQINCLYDYFHDKATRVVQDFVHSDGSRLGACRAFLMLGSPHSLVTEGVEFIHQLANAATYEEKVALLSSAVMTQRPKFRELLTEVAVYKRLPGGDKALVDYDEQEFIQLRDDFNPDSVLGRGPLEVWLAAHFFKTHAARSPGFMFRPEFECLRRVGYVMWDANRLLREKLLRQFEKIYRETNPVMYAEERGNDRPWETRVEIMRLPFAYEYIGLP